jgi:hypothetical protein
MDICDRMSNYLHINKSLGQMKHTIENINFSVFLELFS